MKNNFTLGSLFDGSGGFPLGGLLAGITSLWASEIELFAVRVTTKRLPQMEHYGDVFRTGGVPTLGRTIQPMMKSSSGEMSLKHIVKSWALLKNRNLKSKFAHG